MTDEAHPRILYVGNLDAQVTEELLVTLFGKLGACRGCKLIHEAGADLYAFVEFATHEDAQMALMAMNKRLVLGKEMKVNWATSPGAQTRQDTSKHYHVFVGDLSPDIESHQLREAFAPFGQISDCKVIRDSQTHQSKGFGFVCFIHKEEAEIAIASMNGQWLGGKTIRTNWATGKGSLSVNTGREPSHRTLNYDEVFSQTGPTNTTIYCGGMSTGMCDELMREVFGEYGSVQDVRSFKDKGFAFVKMTTKEAAAKAICATHGTEIGGYIVKCSWGKEMFDLPASGTSFKQQPSYQAPPAQPPQQQQQQQYPPQYPPQGGYGGGGGGGYPGYYGGNMGYWGGYPQQGGYPQGNYPQGGGYPMPPQQPGQQGQQQSGLQGAYNMQPWMQQQGYYGNYGNYGNYGPQWSGANGSTGGSTNDGQTQQSQQGQQYSAQ